MSCFVSDWRSEPTSSTSPNSGWMRDPTELTAPVAGTLGVGVRVTAVAVSVHCVGIVDGSWAYSDQSGVGTAEPTQISWVCALDSPGAPSAAAYSAVGVRLRKSPTPPRRNVVCGPSDPSPQAQVKPRRGDTCTSFAIRSVRTPNSESTARL